MRWASVVAALAFVAVAGCAAVQARPPGPPGEAKAFEVNPYSGVVRPLGQGEVPQEGGAKP